MHYFEVEELAYRAIGKDSKDTEKALNDGDIDDALYEKYEVSFEQYTEIVKDLINFTPLIESPLSKKIYHAFVDTDESRAIIKVEKTNNN